MVKKYKYFYILIALFILSRLLFIFFTPYASFGEERRIGTIGHDLVFEKGLRIPFWAYLDSAHSGGSIFSGLAAVPFYIIFGDRYLALKITALFFSLLTVLLWYRLLFPEIKKSSFFFPLFLLFFSFSIPNYLEKSVLLMGNANEIIFFNALVISYFWKINNNLKPKALDYLLLGIVSGFSFWVQFMNSYLFLAIIIALLVTKRFTQALKYIFLLFAGFLLGAFPLWVYNFLYQWITLVVDTGGISFSFLNLEKLKNLLLTDLPASFHF
ncbi:MAG: hypothetical protein JW734_07845, partial [Candidatus Omnitrophica bacterium]|nr:hypothetical protein [Candidatus Omnitrophota bacterium]